MSAPRAPSGPPTSLVAAVLAAALALQALPDPLLGMAQVLASTVLVAAVPMATRIRRDEVLDSPTREAVYEAVREEPGLCVRDVCDRVDVAWGTAVYHLEVLEENRMVVSSRHGRHRRFFENGATPEGDRDVLAMLQNDTTAEVLETIRSEPGLPQKEVAEAVGLSPQALAWHLDRLAEADLLEKERDGRLVRHYCSGAPGHRRATA